MRQQLGRDERRLKLRLTGSWRLAYEPVSERATPGQLPG